jgi:hypothetical protein
MPPSFGMKAASSAKLRAVKPEIMAPMSKEIMSAGPARPAAIPVTTKMPAPIIAPMPIAIASNRPSVFFNSVNFAPGKSFNKYWDFPLIYVSGDALRIQMSKGNSRIEHYWDLIQFGLVRILIAMGIGFIIASLLNPGGTGRLIGMVLYNPSALSDEFKLDETWILLGLGTGLIIFGILLYTFMYLAEYRFKLFLQKLKRSQTIDLQKKEHSQLLELQFVITISFLITFTMSRALVVLSGESQPSLELWIGNYHIHHFFFGMLTLSISGWISLIGNKKKYKMAAAILYGGGLGLLIDEIGLLLTWGNYWAKQSYVFGVIVIVIFLSIILYEHTRERKR